MPDAPRAGQLDDHPLAGRATNQNAIDSCQSRLSIGSNECLNQCLDRSSMTRSSMDRSTIVALGRFGGSVARLASLSRSANGETRRQPFLEVGHLKMIQLRSPHVL
eukprot:Selendium_serpulae@DN10302_c0_g1_i1.p1